MLTIHRNRLLSNTLDDVRNLPILTHRQHSLLSFQNHLPRTVFLTCCGLSWFDSSHTPLRLSCGGSLILDANPSNRDALTGPSFASAPACRQAGGVCRKVGGGGFKIPQSSFSEASRRLTEPSGAIFQQKNMRAFRKGWTKNLL